MNITIMFDIVQNKEFWTYKPENLGYLINHPGIHRINLVTERAKTAAGKQQLIREFIDSGNFNDYLFHSEGELNISDKFIDADIVVTDKCHGMSYMMAIADRLKFNLDGVIHLGY